MGLPNPFESPNTCGTNRAKNLGRFGAALLILSLVSSDPSHVSETVPSALDSTGLEQRANRPRVPRFSAGEPEFLDIDLANIMTSIITALFGAVHCLAWSFHFPSETERHLWRIASIITTVVPTLWIVIYTLSLMDYLDLLGGFGLGSRTQSYLSGLIVPVYLGARAILLVIAFISLRSLPPAAYETVYWTTFIPHI